MGRRRGFFAELQHQAAVAERDRQRAQAAAARDRAKRHRDLERALASAERANAQAQRAYARDKAAAEREAKRLHVAAQEARVEGLNADLEVHLAEIDAILTATLAVDDYVDLEGLRSVPEHPPFSSQYQQPVEPPALIESPAEPAFVEPEGPKGVSAIFGKKKHAEAVLMAKQEFEVRHHAWQQEVASIPMRQLQKLTEHKAAEDKRLQLLAEDQERYDAECRERQTAADQSNEALDVLIADFAAGKPKAVEEYLGIVFGNSVYPDGLSWDVEYEYDGETRELRLDLEFPRPDELPQVRQYKYVKAKDEISETSQTQKEQRDRYNALVNNMVLRTVHEVWESDRDAKVQSVSLAGGVQHVDPATGKETFTPLIALAVDRETFLDLDLGRVTPAETLKHLKAVVSKNPHGLVGIDTSNGVRGH